MPEAARKKKRKTCEVLTESFAFCSLKHTKSARLPSPLLSLHPLLSTPGTLQLLALLPPSSLQFFVPQHIFHSNQWLFQGGLKAEEQTCPISLPPSPLASWPFSCSTPTSSLPSGCCRLLLTLFPQDPGLLAQFGPLPNQLHLAPCKPVLPVTHLPGPASAPIALSVCCHISAARREAGETKGRNQQVHPQHSMTLENDEARQRIKRTHGTCSLPFICCERDTVTAISSSKPGRLEEPWEASMPTSKAARSSA